MIRDVAPKARFYRITIGPGDCVWIMHEDRTSKMRAEQELAYWRGLFGDLARLELLDGGEDLVVRHMAHAIQTLAKDGCGVTRAMMTDLGFASDVVARRFADALALVTASMPQEDMQAIPSNVVRLIRPPRAVQ